MKLNYIIIPLIVIAVSAIGSIFTSGGMEWYNTLTLPSFIPPGSVIGTVWTVLFILSAVSAILVWNKAPRDHTFPWIIAVFIVNGIVNVLWSWLFFNQHLIYTATWEAGALALSVIVLITLIWPLQRLAAILLIPYALWVCFATYLTYSVWMLNK